MPRLVSSVINAARDRHVAFDKQRNPSGPLYRFLGQYMQVLSGKMLLIDPESTGLLAEMTVDLSAYDFDAGVALDTGTLVVEVVLNDPATSIPQRSYPIELIDPAQRFAPNGPRAAAWQIGNVLYLRGRAEDYQNYGSITLRVTPAVLDQLVWETAGTALMLPDDAELACVEAVALFMAKRGHNDPKLPPIDLGAFKATAAEAETDFLNLVRRRVTGRSFFTADVYRP